MPTDGHCLIAPDTTGEWFRPQCKADRVFLRSIGIYRWRGRRGARVKRGSTEHRAIRRYMAA